MPLQPPSTLHLRVCHCQQTLQSAPMLSLAAGHPVAAFRAGMSNSWAIAPLATYPSSGASPASWCLPASASPPKPPVTAQARSRSSVPHIRIPLLVRRQRGDCETVARPAPQQRPGKDGAVVSPPRSPHLISGGDALPVPSPAPPRAAERAYTRQPTPRLMRVPVRSRPQSLQRLQLRHCFGNLCARSPAPCLRRAPGPPPAASNDGTTQ